MEYKLISQPYYYTKIEQVLRNRGITNCEEFLSIGESDILPVDKIDNIRAAITLIAEAIKNESKIFVQIDEDCDGYTSSAVLLNYLHRFFPNYVENYITYSPHSEKAHGVNLALVPSDTSLVIIPDAGSNQYEEHKKLMEMGMKVLVIDHHEAEQVSPYACVVNNQLCDYPNKSLSGVGMVYKLCCAFDKIMCADVANDFIDLVSLGMIADMMDTRSLETQYLIQKGLTKVNNDFYKGFVAKQAYKVSGGLTQEKVAFYIVPYINAVSRVGSYSDRMTMFEAMLDWKANEMIPSTKRGCKGEYETRVEQAIRICNNNKATKQKNVRDSGLEMAKEFIETNHALDNKILVINLPAGVIDKNINGLIANQLMSEYKRPVLVLQPYTENGETVWAGSARGYEKSQLKDFKQFLTDIPYVLYAEGHKSAFGTAIKGCDMDRFLDDTNRLLKDIEFSPAYDVDFIYNSLKPITANDIYEIADYNYLWGEKIDEPLVVIENLTIKPENVRVMGQNKDTVRMDINGISYVKFLLTPEQVKELTPAPGTYYVITIIGKCNRNVWNDMCSPQIMIEDYEIVRRAYDF